jgi:hypothetical protein
LAATGQAGVTALAAVTAFAAITAIDTTAGATLALGTALATLGARAIFAGRAIQPVGTDHGVLLVARLAAVFNHLQLLGGFLGDARQRDAKEEGNRGCGEEASFHSVDSRSIINLQRVTGAPPSPVAPSFRSLK